MDTRIKDFSTNMMTSTVNKLKESKTSQAESAFYSLFDSAVKNNAGLDNDSQLSRLQENYPQSEQADVSGGQNIKKADVTVSNASENKEISDGVQDTDAVQDTEQTDVEKAQEVIKKFCKELGIDEEQLTGQMDALLDSVMALLMQKFDITEEQLNQVLGELGLTPADLFNNADLMSVLVEISGAGDIAEILTNEDLYVQVQEVMKETGMLFESIVEDGQLKPEELQQLAQSLDIIEQSSAQTEDGLIIEQTGNVENEPDAELPVLEVVDNRPQTEKENFSQENSTMTGQEGFSHFSTQVAQAAREIAEPGIQSFVQNVDMEEIIQQVVERVKLEIQPDTTNIEMQLHPESYGKLNLHVSVREGVVTAQMAVENEMVKSALEAQVVQLKEEMMAKGLKVDAVEVTIASHEFEQNLEDGQQQDAHTQEADNHGHRQINLRNEALTLEELMEMSEQDALARKIMLENGNSIDFSA